MTGPQTRALPCHRSLGLALAALLGAAACAPSAPSGGTSRRPIIGGARDTGDPAVVLLVITRTSPQTEYDCTAFLVSPHVVVTAAHCISSHVIPDLQDFTFRLFLGDNVRDGAQRADPAKWVDTLSVAPHPSFTNSGDPPPYDVGVVVAAAPLAMTPLPLNRGAVQGAWVGQSVRAIGYGMTIPGQVSSFGAKFEASIAMAGFDSGFIWTDDPSKCGCEGDSGGPMVLEIGGTETVVGVDIWVTDPSACTGQLVAARTDIHAGFIDSFIEASDPGFLHPPQDAAVPPRDASQADGSGPADGAPSEAAPADGRADHTRDAGTDPVGSRCASAPGAPAGVLLALAPLVLVTARRRARPRRERRRCASGRQGVGQGRAGGGRPE